jgi:hypothetical protein
MKIDLKSKLTRLLEDSSGAVSVTAAIWLGVAGIALAGLGINGANLYRVKGALQQSSNRAAVAGASQLTTSSQAVAQSTAMQYSSDTATPGLNSINGVQSVTATVATTCVWSLLTSNPTSAIPCPGNGANVVTVTQTATVNTWFGAGTKTISAASAAVANGANGGVTGNLDVAIILDTTASMNNCENGNSGCSAHSFTTPIACPAGGPVAPSWLSSATKVQAAEYAIQTLLCSFTPASGNTGTQVALFTFPGAVATGSTFAAKDYCAAAGTFQKNLSCTGTGVVSYSCSPGYATTSAAANYLIVPFSSNFKTSSTATSLNTASNIVQAVGGSSSCGGLQSPGGWSTYYGGALAAAQAYLTANGRSGTQKVIFLLSDGDANASTGPSNQCQVAVTNADAAATAGTWVFSIAYDSLTGNSTCSKDTTGPYVNNACKAMQNVASSSGNEPDSSKFFAYNGTGSGANCTSNNASLPTLAATFKAAMGSLTSARLINPNCTTVETCRVP